MDNVSIGQLDITTDDRQVYNLYYQWVNAKCEIMTWQEQTNFVYDREEFKQDGVDSGENIDKVDEFDFDFIDVAIEVLEVAGEQKNMMVQTAIFFDHVAYKRFSAVYNDDEIMICLLMSTKWQQCRVWAGD